MVHTLLYVISSDKGTASRSPSMPNLLLAAPKNIATETKNGSYSVIRYTVN